MFQMCNSTVYHQLLPNFNENSVYYEAEKYGFDSLSNPDLPPRYCSLCINTESMLDSPKSLIIIQGSPIPWILKQNQPQAEFMKKCSDYCENHDAESRSCIVTDVQSNDLGVCKCYQKGTNKVFFPLSSFGTHYSDDIVLHTKTEEEGMFPIYQPLINTKVFQSMSLFFCFSSNLFHKLVKIFETSWVVPILKCLYQLVT